MFQINRLQNQSVFCCVFAENIDLISSIYFEFARFLYISYGRTHLKTSIYPLNFYTPTSTLLLVPRTENIRI